MSIDMSVAIRYCRLSIVGVQGGVGGNPVGCHVAYGDVHIVVVGDAVVVRGIKRWLQVVSCVVVVVPPLCRRRREEGRQGAHLE